MVLKEIGKDSFAKGFDYEKAGKLVDRSAQRLYSRWQDHVKHEKDQEAAILKKLKLLADYMKVTMCDGYMTDLLLVFMGCRSDGTSLEVALENMEQVRIQMLRQMQYAGKTAYLLQGITQYVFDERASIKIKYLMRFAIARQTAVLLYQKLGELRTRTGRTDLPKEDLMGFPAMVAEKLHRIVFGYSKM